jgi:hypothetical protein
MFTRFIPQSENPPTRLLTNHWATPLILETLNPLGLCSARTFDKKTRSLTQQKKKKKNKRASNLVKHEGGF